MVPRTIVYFSLPTSLPTHPARPSTCTHTCRHTCTSPGHGTSAGLHIFNNIQLARSESVGGVSVLIFKYRFVFFFHETPDNVKCLSIIAGCQFVVWDRFLLHPSRPNVDVTDGKPAIRAPMSCLSRVAWGSSQGTPSLRYLSSPGSLRLPLLRLVFPPTPSPTLRLGGRCRASDPPLPWPVPMVLKNGCLSEAGRFLAVWGVCG